MPQGQCDCVVSANAAAVRDQERIFRFGSHERNYFIDQIALVLLMPVYALLRREAMAVETLSVYAVHAK